MQSISGHWRRLPLLVAAGVAAALLVTACGGGDSSSTSGGDSNSTSATTTTSASGGESDANDPIVIGRLSAETGRLQVFDGPITQGLELAIEDINQEGGIEGREVVMKKLDYGSDPGRAIAASEELLEQGVDLMVPPDDQAPGLPVIQAATAKNVPSINAISGPQATYEVAGPLYWNDYQNIPSEAAATAAFASEQGYKNVFVLEDQIADYTKGFCSAFEASFKERGGKVIGKDTFTSTEAQIPTQVARAKASNPEAVVLCSVPPGGVAAIKQLRDALPDTPLIGDAGFEGTFWHEAVPNLSNWYNVAAVSLQEKDPALQAMLKQFGKKFGGPTSAQFPALGYTIGELYKAAVEKAGTTETEPVAEALNSFSEQPTVVGPTTYTETCHVPVERPMVVEGLTNGKASVVTEVVPTGVSKDAC